MIRAVIKGRLHVYDRVAGQYSVLSRLPYAFFNGVEVLTKDRPLRENRVGILQHLAGLFLSVADFSKFSI